MAELIKVDPQETLAGLLAEIGRRLNRTTDGTLLLWAPRGTALLRQMEDYQALREALRRGGTRLKILSPDARIVGMALVFGLEAEIALYPPDQASLAQAPEPDGPPTGWASAPLPAGAPAASPTPWPGFPAAAAPPAARDTGEPFGGGEAGWLFGGGVDLPALLAEEDPTRSRSTTPPPDVLAGLPALAAAGPSPGVEPAQETIFVAAPDPAGMAPATLVLRPGDWAAVAAMPDVPPVSGTSNWLHLDEDETPAVSFPQWVAMQTDRSTGAPPAELDLSHLPAWLQATLAAAPPPPRSAVLRCPHCGQELDKEEMLRLLAELWGQ